MMPLSAQRRLAASTGLDIRTLRRFERIGLLVPPSGAPGWPDRLARYWLAGLSDAAIRRLSSLERLGLAGVALHRRILDARTGDIGRRLDELEATLRLIRQELG